MKKRTLSLISGILTTIASILFLIGLIILIGVCLIILFNNNPIVGDDVFSEFAFALGKAFALAIVIFCLIALPFFITSLIMGLKICKYSSYGIVEYVNMRKRIIFYIIWFLVLNIGLIIILINSESYFLLIFIIPYLLGTILLIVDTKMVLKEYSLHLNNGMITEEEDLTI